MEIQENNYNYDPALQNDLILEAIFTHLSTLSDFCSTRLVCKKWNHILNKNLKQVPFEFRLDQKTCFGKWGQIAKFITHHQLPHILVLSLTKYSWHHSAGSAFVSEQGKAEDVEVARNKFIWNNVNILQQTTDFKMMMTTTVSLLVELKLELVCNSKSDAILLYSSLTPCTHLKRLLLEFVMCDWEKGICHFQPDDDNDSCVLPHLHTLALAFRQVTINQVPLPLQPHYCILVHILTRPLFQKLCFLDLDPYQSVHRSSLIVLEALSSITKLLPQLTGLKLNIWKDDLNTMLPQFQQLHHLYLHVTSVGDPSITVSLQHCLQNVGLLFQKLSLIDQLETLDFEWDLYNINDDIDDDQDGFVEITPLPKLTHLSISCGVCFKRDDQQKWTLEQMDIFKFKEILSSRDKFSSLFPSLTHLTLIFYNYDDDDGSQWDYIFPQQDDEYEDDDEIIPQLKYLTISLVVVGSCCKQSLQIDRILTKFPNLVRLRHLIIHPEEIQDRRKAMGCEHVKNNEGEWLVSKWELDLNLAYDETYSRLLHINLMRPELLFNNPEKQHGFWQGLSYFYVNDNYTTTSTDLARLWWRNNIIERWWNLKRRCGGITGWLVG